MNFDIKGLINSKAIRLVCFIFAIYLVILHIFRDYTDDWFLSGHSQLVYFTFVVICTRHYWMQFPEKRKLYEEYDKKTSKLFFWRKKK